jgi:hypothetical protein
MFLGHTARSISQNMSIMTPTLCFQWTINVLWRPSAGRRLKSVFESDCTTAMQNLQRRAGAGAIRDQNTGTDLAVDW